MTYLFILILYSALMILLGVVASRKVRASGDFFVAGRNLSAGFLFSTLLAANIGAGSTVGAAGLGYRDGLSAFWWVGSAGIGSLIMAYTVGPKIWQVARDHKLYTVGDYLEFRYNRTMRGLVALLLWFGSLTILAGQLIAIAWILNVTLGLSKPAGCLIGAAVATIYFTAGGLHSAARVNALQLVIKLVGFGIALIYLLNAVSGLAGIQKTIAGDNSVVDAGAYFSLTGIGAPGVWHYVILLAPSFIVSPGLLQKVFGARNESAVRRGVALNALCLLAFAIVPAVFGIIARSQFPDLANRELALPTLMTQSLPLWLGGLLLGAVFAAEVSTADAVLFMLSTSLAKDLYQTFIKPEAADREIMTMVRVSAAACGLAGALFAILLPTVITALTIFYTLLTAALLLPIVAGLFFTRVTARAAMTAMLVSVAVTFTVERVTAGQGKWGVPSLILGLSAGAVVMLTVALARKN